MRSIRLPAKRPLRGALAGSAAIVAVAGLLLSGASPASASPVPPAPNPALIGTWVNTNPANAFMLDLVLSKSASGALMVDAFKNCSPGCEQGNVQAIVYGANVNAATGSSFQAVILPSDPVDVVLLGTLTTVNSNPVLTVQEFVTAFAAGAFNWVGSETFKPATAPITPQVSGKGGAAYPAGNFVTPVKPFVGTWKIAKADGGINSITISDITGSGSPLTVQVNGTCDPSTCNWGSTVMGSVYGTNISGTPGTTFLAFFKLGFKNSLLSGTISPDGKTLTVSTYSEFIDNSGRANYVLNETFTQN